MTHRLGNILAQTASGSVIAFGALTALAAWPATAPPANLLADLLHWPLNGTEKIDTPRARLLAAIAGGVMVGWGLTHPRALSRSACALGAALPARPCGLVRDRQPRLGPLWGGTERDRQCGFCTGLLGRASPAPPAPAPSGLNRPDRKTAARPCLPRFIARQTC